MKSIKTIVLCLTGAFLFSCKCEKNPADQTTTVPVTDSISTAIAAQLIDENGNFIYEVGELTDITLPDGTILNVGAESTEYQLFNQLSDTAFVVSEDKTKDWIHLDRVYFKTGSAELTPESEEQVQNIIALLKAYPDTQIKLGGYTDNVGGQDVNMAISTERAKVVEDKIEAGGVHAGNISSEGYGANHFVCPANDSNECRAQNRRVDIRIIKK